MTRIAIWGDPPADQAEALAGALAVRGLAVAADAGVGVAIGTGPPAGARALLIVADLAEAAAIGWLDRGVDVVPAAAGPALIAARVAAALRGATIRAEPLAIGPLAIDPLAGTVARAGRPVPLLPREYRLLLHLARTPGEPVSRAELARSVWGLRFDPGTNVVAVHVSRLRARLDRGHERALIETVRGVGYRLAP